MTPFSYPEVALVRKHEPVGYLDPNSFRPWLRDEFEFRCVYCLRRERWEPDVGVFEIDHLDPVSRSPALCTIYQNLLYSCTTCNAAKQDQVIPNPAVVLNSSTIVVDPDGGLRGLTTEAKLLIRLLDLNDPMFITWRMRMIRIVALAQLHDPDLYRHLLAHPDDLPDLSRLRPPGGNAKPEGVADLHFERRRRGELPPIY